MTCAGARSGRSAPARRPSWVASLQASIDAGVMIGAFDGGRLVGTARYHPMRQWWHGRSMPMAGVAGVKVAPEERGRGVGTAMMTRLLDEISERGFAVSVLFPTTAPLYRGMGWEIAGGRYETVLPARALTALANPDQPAAAGQGAPKLRRATPADGAAIVAVQGLVHERLLHCGPSTREPSDLRDWLDDEDHFTYLADDGFLSYRWSADRDGDRGRGTRRRLGGHGPRVLADPRLVRHDGQPGAGLPGPGRPGDLADARSGRYDRPARNLDAAARRRPGCDRRPRLPGRRERLGPPRSHRPGPARELRPLGAGGVRRRGKPDAPGPTQRPAPARARSASAPAASPPSTPASRSPPCGWPAWQQAAIPPPTTRSAWRSAARRS